MNGNNRRIRKDDKNGKSKWYPNSKGYFNSAAAVELLLKTNWGKK